MKPFWKEFFLRALVAMGFGPIVLSVIYCILGAGGTIQTLGCLEVAKGYLSITAMAFIAGGITAIYQTEWIPLPFAIATHCCVLYADYLIMYLFNDWIPKNFRALGVFTAVFVGGYALIWLLIYLIHKKRIQALNQSLSKT